jgi:hypothetical protein
VWKWGCAVGCPEEGKRLFALESAAKNERAEAEGAANDAAERKLKPMVCDHKHKK